MIAGAHLVRNMCGNGLDHSHEGIAHSAIVVIKVIGEIAHMQYQVVLIVVHFFHQLTHTASILRAHIAVDDNSW